MNTTIQGSDGKTRCKWANGTPEYIAYHDQEWGFPVDDDRHLFEKLCLESFQSGLSWRTILTKRDNFRTAFKNFEIDQVAAFDQNDVARLLGDAGIVRHRGKIEAVINNARQAQKIIEEVGTLAAYIWRYEPVEAVQEPQIATTSPESVALSKDLKKRGWKFVGPTTMYAFMQSMGLINDHSVGCLLRIECETARDKFVPPVVDQ